MRRIRAFQGTSIEVWIRSVDPLVIQNAVFTYGVRNLREYVVHPKVSCQGTCLPNLAQHFVRTGGQDTPRREENKCFDTQACSISLMTLRRNE